MMAGWAAELCRNRAERVPILRSVLSLVRTFTNFQSMPLRLVTTPSFVL